MAPINPCFLCHKSHAEGLECDTCKNWFCPLCIEAACEGSLTPELYTFLSKISSFPWRCQICCELSLPRQLLDAQLLTEQKLFAFKVPYSAFAPTARVHQPAIGGFPVTTTTYDWNTWTATARSHSPSPPGEGAGETITTVTLPIATSAAPIYVPVTTSVAVTNVPPPPVTVGLGARTTRHGVPVVTSAAPAAISVSDPLVQQLLHQQAMQVQVLADQGRMLADCMRQLQSFALTQQVPPIPVAPAGFTATLPAALGVQGTIPVTTAIAPRVSLGLPYMSAPTLGSGAPIFHTGLSLPGSVPISTGFSGAYPARSWPPSQIGAFPGGSVGAAASSQIPPPSASMPLSNFNVGGNVSGNQFQLSPKLRLPKMELRIFSGDLDEFKGWWEFFHANVDSQPIDQRVKWDYLMACIKGAAFKKIEGLGNSSANYPEAIQILNAFYGRDDLLKPNLWLVLDQLKPVKANYSNLEEFTDTVRAKAISL